MTAGLLSSSTGLASAELDWPISAAWIQFVGVVVTNYIESPKPNFKNPCEMIARATYEHDEKAYTFSRLCTSDIATENGKRFFPREVILEIVATETPWLECSLRLDEGIISTSDHFAAQFCIKSDRSLQFAASNDVFFCPRQI